jgi:cytochrome c oxidase assembly protein subunit 11
MSKQTSNSSIAFSIAAVVVGMFCLAYASVPLYNLFCKVTGFGGTTQVATTAPSKILDREMTVRFNTNTNPNLPWDFKPEQKEVTMRIGERRLVFFSAVNTSDETTTGTSIYNVTPLKAGGYFNKIECFCFEEQTIKPGEKVHFPVSFFIDPSITEEKNLEDVTTITLSYTFFPVKK